MLSRCGDMLKLGGNTTISFPGAFFIGFLWFLFMIVFYLAYKIHVRNFVRLCWVVVEICWNWVEVLPFHYGCVFYSISLISFCEHVLFSLRNTRTKFRAAVLCGCGDMLKMGWNSTILFPGVIPLISFYEHVLFILRNPHRKFHAAVASGCGKWVEIRLLYIWVMDSWHVFYCFFSWICLI